MEIAVHGRRVDVPNDVRQLAERKLAHLDRYLAGLERAEVCFSNGRPGRLGDPCTCEVVVEGHGHVIRAQGSGGRQPDALDAALERATHRARRVKDKLIGRSRPRHGAGGREERRPSKPGAVDEVAGP